MKSKRIIAMLCTLAVMFSSSGGLPISDRGLFDTAVTVSAAYTDVTSFNNASESNPTLNLAEDYNGGMTITRSDGTINLNNHSIKGTLYLQGTDRSKTLTINNGTITGSIDGKDGFNTTFTYWSNIVLNDITVNGQVYSEGHDITINGGTYKGTVGVYTYQNAEYTSTLTVNEGYFYKIFELNQGSITGGNAVGGNVVLYGGSFVEKPTRYTYYRAPSGLEKDSFIASGKTVISCSDTVGGQTFNYKVVPEYTLTFNANNGSLPSGAASTQKVGYTGKYGEFGSLPTPTRNDYMFDGWYTAASGGTQVTDATQYNTNGNSTIYAHWTAIVASVTAGGTTTSYTSLSDALSAWTDDSTLTLLEDVETSSTINISGTKVLDLNGYGIKMTGSGSVINVGNGANLTLKDSNPDVKHKYTIANPQSNGAGLAVVDDTNGTQSFTGGYITGGNAEYGGGVYTNGGNIIINGGTIIGNKVSSSSNTKGGGGVCIDAGTLTMKDGAVIGNYAYLAKGAQGGGLTLLSTANFTMSGGIISCNYSNGCGGGVQANNYAVGNITISGGKICNNYTKQGGGINSGGTVNLTGGSICDNIADNGGGICAQKVILSGSAIIQNNNKQISGKSDICLYGSKLLTINAQLNENNSNPIVVGIYQGGTGIFTNSTNTAYNDSSKFISDNDNYAIAKNADGQLCLVTAVTVIFDADGGSAVKNQTVASGNTADEPTAPTKTGYTFDGWYDGDTKFDFTTPITEDTTLTAKWLKNPTYTVTIPADVKCSNSNSASATVSAEYDVGELYTLSVAVTSENNFQLKANYDNRVLIPYTIMCDDKRLSMGQTEILSVSGNGEQSKTLNFSVDPSQMYAGAYSDTLTFNISLT